MFTQRTWTDTFSAICFSAQKSQLEELAVKCFEKLQALRDQTVYELIAEAKMHCPGTGVKSNKDELQEAQHELEQ